MVEIRMRGNEKLQEAGSMHWRRLTLGDWLGFGFLWISSLYCIGLFFTPGAEQVIIMFLVPFLGGMAALVGSVLWLLFLIGFIGFAVGIPGAIMHNSIKYSEELNTEMTWR